MRTVKKAILLELAKQGKNTPELQKMAESIDNSIQNRKNKTIILLDEGQKNTSSENERIARSKRFAEVKEAKFIPGISDKWYAILSKNELMIFIYC